MRLINTKTFRLHTFGDETRPKYAILSHTWGENDQELQFDEMEGLGGDLFRTTEAKASKIRFCCKQAADSDIEYVWIDTCCIDKKNSVELHEAINSMFRWYKEAHVCYALLSDYKVDPSSRQDFSRLGLCRWFTRGWTLQELLAPDDILFFDRDWNLLGDMDNLGLLEALRSATSIPTHFLKAAVSIKDASIAQRMSWAAHRQTTRPEDRAYCLLGIFDVEIDLRYGFGGERAFRRLLEGIIKNCRDDSILAWGYMPREITERESQGNKHHGGLFAPSPAPFRHCGDLVRSDTNATFIKAFDSVNGRIPVEMCLYSHEGAVYGILDCRPYDEPSMALAIPLRRENPRAGGPIRGSQASTYVRPRDLAPILVPSGKITTEPEEIHIIIESPPVADVADRQDWIYLADMQIPNGLNLADVWPVDSWKKDTGMIQTSASAEGADASNLYLIRFEYTLEAGDDVVVGIKLESGESEMPVAHCSVVRAGRSTTLSEVAAQYRHLSHEDLQNTNFKVGYFRGVVKITQKRIGIHDMFCIRFDPAVDLGNTINTIDITLAHNIMIKKIKLVDLMTAELEYGMIHRDATKQLELAKELGKKAKSSLDTSLKEVRQARKVLEEAEKRVRNSMLLYEASLKRVRHCDAEANIRALEVDHSMKRREDVMKLQEVVKREISTLLESINSPASSCGADELDLAAAVYEYRCRLHGLAPGARDLQMPIKWAATSGHLSLVKELLKSKQQAPWTQNELVEAVVGASANDHIHVVDYLLDTEIPLKLCTDDELTATLFKLAQSRNNPFPASVIRRKLNGLYEDASMADILSWATRHDYRALVTAILLQAGTDLSKSEGEFRNMTPFQIACLLGDLSTCEQLLDAGVRIDHHSEIPQVHIGTALSKNPLDGTCGFSLAMIHGHFEIAALILRKDMTVLDKDYCCIPPLARACTLDSKAFAYLILSVHAPMLNYGYHTLGNIKKDCTLGNIKEDCTSGDVSDKYPKTGRLQRFQNRLKGSSTGPPPVKSQGPPPIKSQARFLRKETTLLDFAEIHGRDWALPLLKEMNKHAFLPRQKELALSWLESNNLTGELASKDQESQATTEAGGEE